MIKFLDAPAILNQDDLKIWMNRIKAIWQNGCFEKMDDHAVYTIPNHHSSKTDVLPKTFVQITLATKWLVKHSNTFLLSLSYFYASGLLLGGHDLTDFASCGNRTWSTPYPQDYVRHTCVDKIP